MKDTVLPVNLLKESYVNEINVNITNCMCSASYFPSLTQLSRGVGRVFVPGWLRFPSQYTTETRGVLRPVRSLARPPV